MNFVDMLSASWRPWPLLLVLLAAPVLAQPPPPTPTPAAANDKATPRDRVRQGLREHFQNLRENRGGEGQRREGGPGQFGPPEGAPPPWGMGREGERPGMGPGMGMGRDGERPGMGMGPEGRRPGPPPLDRFMERYRQQNPEDFERLKTLHQQDPEAFRDEVRQLAEKKFREYREAQQATETALQELVEQHQLAKDEATKLAVKAKMQTLLGQGFDERLKTQEESVARLEKQLAEARKQLDERRGKRDEIINARITHLLYPPEEDELPAARPVPPPL